MVASVKFVLPRRVIGSATSSSGRYRGKIRDRKEEAISPSPTAERVIAGRTKLFTRTVVLVLALGACTHVQPFDSKEWQAAWNYGGKGTPTVRQRMVRDIMERVLPGKTKPEIEAILGPSLETPYLKSTGRDLIYILGPEREGFFKVDSEWLLIWLDGTGHFMRADLATD
jgi:hypothetical protein